MQTVPGTFRLVTGAPAIYVKTGDSGNKREQSFCPTCGSPIYSAPVGAAGAAIGLRVGTIRQRAQLIPTEQFWFRSAQPWLPQLPAMKRQDKQPVFSPTGAARET